MERGGKVVPDQGNVWGVGFVELWFKLHLRGLCWVGAVLKDCEVPGSQWIMGSGWRLRRG